MPDLSNRSTADIASYQGTIGGWADAALNPNAIELAYDSAKWREEQSFNSAEAQKQRDFEERMSNTAYQRAAADLGELGFSPMALLQSGTSASTPSGSAASASGGGSPGIKKSPVLDGMKDALKLAIAIGLGIGKASSASSIAELNSVTKLLSTERNASNANYRNLANINSKEAIANAGFKLREKELDDRAKEREARKKRR